MTRSNSEAALRAHLAQVARADMAGIGLEDDLVLRLGLDSLAALRMLATIERRFGVRFPDERLAELRTMRLLLACIDGAAKGGAPCGSA